MHCTPQKPGKTQSRGRFLITVLESLVLTQQEGNKVDSNFHSRDCGNSIYLCPGQEVIYSHRITFVQLSSLCWILFSVRFSVFSSFISVTRTQDPNPSQWFQMSFVPSLPLLKHQQIYVVELLLEGWEPPYGYKGEDVMQAVTSYTVRKEFENLY